MRGESEGDGEVMGPEVLDGCYVIDNESAFLPEPTRRVKLHVIYRNPSPTQTLRDCAACPTVHICDAHVTGGTWKHKQGVKPCRVVVGEV